MKARRRKFDDAAELNAVEQHESAGRADVVGIASSQLGTFDETRSFTSLLAARIAMVREEQGACLPASAEIA